MYLIMFQRGAFYIIHSLGLIWIFICEIVVVVLSLHGFRDRAAKYLERYYIIEIILFFLYKRLHYKKRFLSLQTQIERNGERSRRLEIRFKVRDWAY